MFGAVLIIICAGLLSWYLISATLESIEAFFTEVSGISAGMLALFLFVDYWWIQALIYIARNIIFIHFPSWCIWCSG